MDMEMSHGDSPSIGDKSSNSLLGTTRCCFCFGSRRSSGGGLSWWHRIRSSKTDSTDNPWWSKGFRALKKIREWSEIVAGPKWKTFIRRFNRNKNSGGSTRHGKFQYDPLSYALNFDEGPGQNGNSDEYDEYGGFRDFSSRYASVSGSGKPLTMDASRSNDVAVIA